MAETRQSLRRTIRIYMAGPLFTLAELAHNKRLAGLLEAHNPAIVCVLPQERQVQPPGDLKAVAQDCFEQIDASDLVIACADGAETDSGTAVEIGYARGKGVPTIVYRTDFRGSEIEGVNAMVRFGCTEFLNLPAHSTSLEILTEKLLEAVTRLVPRLQSFPLGAYSG